MVNVQCMLEKDEDREINASVLNEVRFVQLKAMYEINWGTGHRDTLAVPPDSIDFGKWLVVMTKKLLYTESNRHVFDFNE